MKHIREFTDALKRGLLFLQQNSIEELRLKLNENEEVLTQTLHMKMTPQTKKFRTAKS